MRNVLATGVTGLALLSAVAGPATAAEAPKALAVCDSVTQVMLCKPMDTLSLPPSPTLGDARVEAQRRYGQQPWVCELNIAGRVEVETCVLPLAADSTPLADVLAA
jgi:hypothetical protein